MNITIEPVALENRRPKPADESKLGFGKIYSDHMFTMRWTADGGWSDARVGAFDDLSLSPAALVLHYGQTVFEGLKAYPNPNGTVNLFRARDNAARFARSAARLDLPTVDTDMFVAACQALVDIDQRSADSVSRVKSVKPREWPNQAKLLCAGAKLLSRVGYPYPVSYTHLTLPTIYSV